MTSNPVYCQAGDSIVSVADTMKREDVGSLPVIDARDRRRLIGMLTDRDIVIKVVARGGDIRNATVQDAMTANPLSCHVDDKIDDAVRIMSERQVRRLPVVDTNGALTGIIAQADIATREKRDNVTAELVGAISEPS